MTQTATIARATSTTLSVGIEPERPAKASERQFAGPATGEPGVIDPGSMRDDDQHDADRRADDGADDVRVQSIRRRRVS